MQTQTPTRKENSHADQALGLAERLLEADRLPAVIARLVLHIMENLK